MKINTLRLECHSTNAIKCEKLLAFSGQLRILSELVKVTLKSYIYIQQNKFERYVLALCQYIIRSEQMYGGDLDTRILQFGRRVSWCLFLIQKVKTFCDART